MTPPSITQLVIILLIIVLLFGAKKIPELARGLGSGIKNFKKAVKEDDEAENAEIIENGEHTKEQIATKKPTKARSATRATKTTKTTKTSTKRNAKQG